MPACLSALLPHDAFRGRVGERERESVCVCVCVRERMGKNGLRLAVRLVVRTKAWLAACLGGQVAGWSASCLLIAGLRSAVPHLMYAFGTLKERVRERERERERKQ